MDLTKLTIKDEQKEKTAFHASDFGKPILDLYFAFIGERKTNPIEWNTMIRLGAGKGAEENMLKVLKDSGVVNENYNQETDGRVDFVREGVTIHGYIDAINKQGEPIEIKTINNKNEWDIRRYQAGNPRDNYVGQLAVYMDFLGKDTGHLFVASLDGLNYFSFPCRRIRDKIYTCGNTTIDLDKEYKRWSNLFKENIVPKKEPDIFEFTYKVPVEKIDWSKISATDISKARNGRKVIGDWQVQYSPYKDLIIKKQGATLGYTDDELKAIILKTKGYSSKNK